MDTSFLFKGLIIGFLISAPVGPIAILCLRRTFTRGRSHGLVSGLGAAAADAVYGFIVAFSLTFISDFIVAHQIIFRSVGATFLFFLGIKTFFSHIAERPSTVTTASFARDFTSTFALTLMNPITLLAFTAIFAGVGLTQSTHSVQGLLVAGVFIGAAAWWLLLTTVAAVIRKELTPANLLWLTRISGIIIILFACGIVLSLLI
jgi:threonine/homoserine/homoserine lactone efflux protein